MASSELRLTSGPNHFVQNEKHGTRDADPPRMRKLKALLGYLIAVQLHWRRGGIRHRITAIPDDIVFALHVEICSLFGVVSGIENSHEALPAWSVVW